MVMRIDGFDLPFTFRDLNAVNQSQIDHIDIEFGVANLAKGRKEWSPRLRS